MGMKHAGRQMEGKLTNSAISHLTTLLLLQKLQSV